MATLHTVHRSPYRETTLASCLRMARPGSAILLLEDGVYAAVAAGAHAPRLREAMARLRVFALEADLAARGIAPDELIDGIATVDYEGFVDLACEHAKVQAWL